jgi:hypothetical protein
MSDFLPSVRKEVRDYLRSSEYLLSAALTPHTPPFSQEERAMVGYYVGEVVTKILDPGQK